jgi:mevalonate pyrophosphate decarboxylase
MVPPEKLGFVRVAILLANDKKKDVSSTDGMASSVATSQLIRSRNQLASERIELILSCLDRYGSESEGDKPKTFNTIMENISKVFSV